MNGTSTSAHAPTWLHCESCGATEELRLGLLASDEILCKRCRRRKRSGPAVEVHTYHVADRDVVELMVERRIRAAFDRFGERLAKITVKIDAGDEPGAKRCRLFVSLRNGTQLASECVDDNLDRSLARAIDRLDRRLEGSKRQHVAAQARASH